MPLIRHTIVDSDDRAALVECTCVGKRDDWDFTNKFWAYHQQETVCPHCGDRLIVKTDMWIEPA